jgi:hypothetical protein
MIKRLIFGLALVAMLLVAGCVQSAPINEVPSQPSGETQGNEVVNIIFNEEGIDCDRGEIIVKNLYAGARAEQVFRIHNGISETIIPDIFPIMNCDIENYSRADGAVKAPEYVSSWVELPPFSEIAPGEYRDFVVALQMPEDAEKPAEKFGFVLSFAVKVSGGTRPAIGVWWLVSMR